MPIFRKEQYMDTIQILSKALLELDRVEHTAGLNDAAYRKQCRIILSSPGVQHALARARDAPDEPAPKPVRKRTPKPKEA